MYTLQLKTFNCNRECHHKLDTYVCRFVCRCIWHIGKSIITNLTSVLGNRTNEFLQRFYTVNNCVGKAAFKELWGMLLEDYPEAEHYMEKQFGGEHMHRWGLPWQVRIRLTIVN